MARLDVVQSYIPDAPLEVIGTLVEVIDLVRGGTELDAVTGSANGATVELGTLVNRSRPMVDTGRTRIPVDGGLDVKPGEKVFVVLRDGSVQLVDRLDVLYALETIRKLLERVTRDEEKPSPTLTEYLSCLLGMETNRRDRDNTLITAGKMVHNVFLPLAAYELEVSGCDVEVEKGRWVEVGGVNIYVEPDLVARCGGRTILFELKFSTPRSQATWLRYIMQILVYTWIVDAHYACLIRIDREGEGFEYRCFQVSERHREAGRALIEYAVSKCGRLEKPQGTLLNYFS